MMLFITFYLGYFCVHFTAQKTAIASKTNAVQDYKVVPPHGKKLDFWRMELVYKSIVQKRGNTRKKIE